MKILYFVHYYPPHVGAASFNSHKIVEYLSKYGHEVRVISQGDQGNNVYLKDIEKYSIPNVKVYFSNPAIKLPFNIVISHLENLVKYLLKMRKSFSPDIIMSQYHAYHFASVVGGYLSKILDIPHIIRSHDIFLDSKPLSFPINLIYKLSFTRVFKSIQSSNIFYVNTSEMKDYLSNLKRLRKVNFKIHPNGIDTKDFYPFKNQEDLKGEYGCENILLFVGLLAENYALQNLVKVLPQILKTHKDTIALIIGDGPSKNKIMKFVNNHNLKNQAHLLGIKPHGEIPYYMNNCDIGIGLLKYKNYLRYVIPVKCLEYMACKKTFVTTACSTDIIKDNDVGLLLNNDYTIKELSDKIIKLIEDKGLRSKLGENGYKKINDKFRWDMLMDYFNDDIINSIQN
jgi:glycosyltransferase involved in cell wall biosynthesis